MRQSGKTYQLLRACEHNSVFVCAESEINIQYVYKLCMKIGGSINLFQNTWRRSNGAVVRIFSCRVLTYRGMDVLSGHMFHSILVDHGFKWKYENASCFMQLHARTRSPDVVSNRSQLAEGSKFQMVLEGTEDGHIRAGYVSLRVLPGSAAPHPGSPDSKD